MLFNSLSFLIFLPTVFLLYWFATNKSLKTQNWLLLITSYYFYSCWDWRFLFLLAFSTALDYFTGLQIHKSQTLGLKKMWLIISVGVNLGFLGFFKYYNFFAESFADFVQLFGFRPSVATLHIILPVGISFYTFHGLSYVIDIYYGRIKPSTNWVQYSLFVSFFPLLVAGPIERATHLLPQVERPRIFNYHQAVDGLKQILWGFIKKVVIADNCAAFANQIFDHSGEYSGMTLVWGAILFAFQIYGDFSGYTDIALGTARLFGFELLKNFNYPYFSRNIAEFWKRWHISLSSWFRDYLYIPLGGSRDGLWKTIRNTFVIFLVSGFWHGANWTFVVWGGLNALFIMPSVIWKPKNKPSMVVAEGRLFPSLREAGQLAVTFILTTFAWIFFRAESLTHALAYISRIFTANLLENPFRYAGLRESILCLLLIIPFLIIEWLGRTNNYAIETLGYRWPKLMRWSFYSACAFVIGMYMQTGGTEFIYFQF
ncbi:MBOAT family O-acyltransferase [Olivibacter sp. CPCC 100613]|uniref:MBOAT family O-acyltransferase n=1 Tax=Olivibacter sp. CPCC 100613 TaxID=3079931 RepID=UPI002FF5C394